MRTLERERYNQRGSWWLHQGDLASSWVCLSYPSFHPHPLLGWAHRVVLRHWVGCSCFAQGGHWSMANMQQWCGGDFQYQCSVWWFLCNHLFPLCYNLFLYFVLLVILLTFCSNLDGSYLSEWTITQQGSVEFAEEHMRNMSSPKEEATSWLTAFLTFRSFNKLSCSSSEREDKSGSSVGALLSMLANNLLLCSVSDSRVMGQWAKKWLWVACMYSTAIFISTTLPYLSSCSFSHFFQGPWDIPGLGILKGRCLRMSMTVGEDWLVKGGWVATARWSPDI